MSNWISSCFWVRVVFIRYLIVLIVSDPLRYRPIKKRLRPRVVFVLYLCRDSWPRLANGLRLRQFELIFIWIINFELGNLNENFKLLFGSNNLIWKYYLNCCLFENIIWIVVLGICKMCEFKLQKESLKCQIKKYYSKWI